MYTKQDRETGLPLTGRGMYTKQDRETGLPLTGRDMYTKEDRATEKQDVYTQLDRKPIS